MVPLCNCLTKICEFRQTWFSAERRYVLSINIIQLFYYLYSFIYTTFIPTFSQLHLLNTQTTGLIFSIYFFSDVKVYYISYSL